MLYIMMKLKKEIVYIIVHHRRW